MKKIIFLIAILFGTISSVFANFGSDAFNKRPFGYSEFGTGAYGERSGVIVSGPSADALLLESGDFILLESGDFILIE